MSAPTPSQTAGPYFHLGLTERSSIGSLVKPETRGERIRLRCRVIDGEGKPVPDAMIEIWQANAEGKYNHPDDAQQKPIDPAFLGFGRLATDAEAACVFTTIKPGRLPDAAGILQASHINISVFARGILKRLATRAYFSGDPATAEDPVLSLVPPERRSTLLAHPDQTNATDWSFDIHLSGPKETVFFDV